MSTYEQPYDAQTQILHIFCTHVTARDQQEWASAVNFKLDSQYLERGNALLPAILLKQV